MGVVYEATQVKLHRRVAVKVIARHLSSDPDFVKRFEREARVAASIDHPNVVSVHDFGEQDGVRYMVMALVEGQDLGAELKARGPLAPTRTVRIAAEVASGLEAAHRLGLVHRDIKPSNILISGEGASERAVVTDLGLMRTAGNGSVTDTKVVMGSLSYMSPEQLQGKPVDARSDVYALGCLLFEMLTGQAPFPSDDAAALVAAHLHSEPPHASQLSGTNPSLDTVIFRAMQKDPARRYATAGEFASEAERALGQTAAAAGGAETVVQASAVGATAVDVTRRSANESGTGPQGSKPRSNKMVVGLAAAGVCLLLGGVLVAVLGSGPSPTPLQATVTKTRADHGGVDHHPDRDHQRPSLPDHLSFAVWKCQLSLDEIIRGLCGSQIRADLLSGRWASNPF